MQHEWQQWLDAVGRAEVDEAIGGLYARLDADVAARGPTCWSSGKCCKFDSYGHRLYVTGLEISRFMKHVGCVMSDARRQDRTEASAALPVLNIEHRPSDIRHRDACVYQVEGLCSTHAIRPLGCRIYFCQQGTRDWQRGLYERYQDELRAMHDRFGLSYRYMEWRAGIEECVMFDG